MDVFPPDGFSQVRGEIRVGSKDVQVPSDVSDMVGVVPEGKRHQLQILLPLHSDLILLLHQLPQPIPTGQRPRM
eukprot:414563-Hanusia_phi.AAC.2